MVTGGTAFPLWSAARNYTPLQIRGPRTASPNESARMRRTVKITLNGDPFDVAGPLTVTGLLARLEIDARRVAVEHNLVVVKRGQYDTVEIRDGDEVEIVNFVGGG